MSNQLVEGTLLYWLNNGYERLSNEEESYYIWLGKMVRDGFHLIQIDPKSAELELKTLPKEIVLNMCSFIMKGEVLT